MLAEPPALAAILADSRALGFRMASTPELGPLLRTLAATKPGGRLLELGTGTGVATAWLLDGMDPDARLISVDREAQFQEVARRHLDGDERCTFVLREGREFILAQRGRFDLIFADAWSGKFYELDETLALLAPGGIYIVDDLVPQPDWPAEHAAKVDALVKRLLAESQLIPARLECATGLLVAAKRR